MAITGKNRFGNIPLWGGGTYSVPSYDVDICGCG
ncbi:ORFL14W_IRL [Human betaherpesvirus 5]|nr:ORFL14C [Human betaherpesvirus 5]QHX40303.1 ORFL14C_TRL [Human betaherpesvirus 5]QHX40670.1 ORFL14W_IRL [Human betaherpesvirus 5]